MSIALIDASKASPQELLTEMESLSDQHGLKEFTLLNDDFAADSRRLKDFCDYFARNNHYDFRYSVNVELKSVTVDALVRLQSSGCNGVRVLIPFNSAAETEALNIQVFKVLELIKVIQVPTEFIIAQHGFYICNEMIRLGSHIREDGDFTVHFKVSAQNFSVDESARLECFYNECVNHMGHTLHQIFVAIGITPVELWRKWELWYSNRFKSKPLDRETVRDHFPTFHQVLMGRSASCDWQRERETQSESS